MAAAITVDTSTANGLGRSGTMYQGFIDEVALLNKFDINSDLYQRYNEAAAGFINTLIATGRESVAVADTYYHYEKDWLTKAQKISAKSAVASGAVTLTIDPSSLDGTNPTIARVNDVILFKNDMKGFITAKPAYNQVTFVPATANFTITQIQAAITVGDTFAIIGNAMGEASTKREGINVKPLMFSNRTQITRDADEFTGTVMSNKQVIKVEGKEYYYLSQELDKHATDKIQQAMIALTSEGVDVNGIATTKGLIPSIKSLGIQYSKSPVWTLQDFQNLNIMFDSELAPKELMLGYGNRLGNEIQNALFDVTRNGAVQYGAIGGEQKALALGFDSVKIGAYTYHLKQEDMFHHKQTLGIAGSNYVNSAYVVPLSMDKDAKGQNIPSIQLRYKEQGDGVSRKYRTWYKDIETNGDQSKDAMQVECISHWGMQFFGLNRFAWIS